MDSSLVSQSLLQAGQGLQLQPHHQLFLFFLPASDPPADVSPSATTVETNTVAAETFMSAIASTSAQEVAPLPYPPFEEEAKSSRGIPTCVEGSEVFKFKL